MVAGASGYQVSREKRAVVGKANLHFQALAGPKSMSLGGPNKYQ